MSFQRLKIGTGLLLGICLFFAFQTEAQAAAAVGTIGGVVNSLNASISNLPVVLSFLGWVTGLFFAIWGIFKFKDHVDNPSQTPLSAGVKRFIAGGMLLSSGYVMTAARNSLTAGVANKINDTGRSTPVAGGGMDRMIYDFISNLAGPMESLLTAFTYIAAIGLLMVAISRLTKTMQEGPRGPAGMGTLMTFVAAGALFSFGDMMGNFASSLFGNATLSTMANISPTVLRAADAARVAPVIEAVMAFIMIVGYIAFIRGWFVLRAFADGNNNATLAQGLTFLIGGTLAINLGELVNVLQTTVGVSGITFG